MASRKRTTPKGVRASGRVKDTVRIDRMDQIRVLTHPLRMRLLERFAGEPCTTKQAAEAMGENPTKLYHHVYALERAGLVRRVEQRPVRGTVENYYQAVARRFEVDGRAFAALAAKPVAGASVASLLEAGRSEAMAALARMDPAAPPLLARLIIGADARRIREVRAELAKWLQSVGETKGAAKPGRKTAARTAHEVWALTVSFVPVAERAKRPR